MWRRRWRAPRASACPRLRGAALAVTIPGVAALRCLPELGIAPGGALIGRAVVIGITFLIFATFLTCSDELQGTRAPAGRQMRRRNAPSPTSKPLVVGGGPPCGPVVGRGDEHVNGTCGLLSAGEISTRGRAGRKARRRNAATRAWERMERIP